MTAKRKIVAAGILVGAFVAVALAVTGGKRLKDAREFSQPHQVATHGGTNYVVRVTAATVGKTSSGSILILHLQFTNPNPFPVVLDRNWFVLMDHDKDYYLPSADGPQAPQITLPASGQLDGETLTFAVPDDSFEGVVALLAGRQYMIMIKNQNPWRQTLHDGQFESFRSRDW
jgi:hypothetical protein